MRILFRRHMAALGFLLQEKDDAIYGLSLQLQGADKEIAHLRQMLLGTYRASRDMAEGFRRAQEEDDDVTADMAAIVCELSDQIAQLEEHI